MEMLKIWMYGNYQCEVKPIRKVVIEGYEEYDFYATRDVDFKSKIVITEAKTGCAIGGSGRTIKEAIILARRALCKYTKDDIAAKIELELRHQKDILEGKNHDEPDNL